MEGGEEAVGRKKKGAMGVGVFLLCFLFLVELGVVTINRSN